MPARLPHAAGYIYLTIIYIYHCCKNITCHEFYLLSAGKSAAEVSVWKTDWSQKSPQVEQEAQPTGHHLDPH